MPPVLPALLALAAAAAAVPRPPGTIAETPVAPAGAQAAAIHPNEEYSGWRGVLGTGVAGKLGGMRLESAHPNEKVLLYFGAQADGSWPESHHAAARLRLRMFTGGEGTIYVPSEGDAEAAFMLGPRPELRFVLARVEAARSPTLALDTLLQAATLPSFEGAVPLAGDRVRLNYQVSPVEVAWVYYHGGAHVRHRAGWPSESDRPVAASMARLRWTTLLPADLLLSVQGDFLKLWRASDLLLGAEGSLARPILDQSAGLALVVRWSGYTRRGVVPDTSETESEVVVLAAVNLVL